MTISPVQALRVEGTHDRWLEPIEWEGSFSLDEEGNVEGAAMRMEQVGEFSRQGIHVILNAHHAETLYEVVDGEARPVEAMDHDEMGTTRYFAVDVTDHVVNYEEKLVGADVTLTFTQGDTSFDVTLPPVISPVMGFHYGANVELAPGEWTITATVGGLDFQRHAGAAVSLPPVRCPASLRTRSKKRRCKLGNLTPDPFPLSVYGEGPGVRFYYSQGVGAELAPPATWSSGIAG